MFKQQKYKSFNARVSGSVAVAVISMYADITVNLFGIPISFQQKKVYQSVLCKIHIIFVFNEVHTYLMTVLQML